MGTKAERRAARELVAAYHEARLGELVSHVAEAIDRHRAGELDAFEVDQVIHHYKLAARKHGRSARPRAYGPKPLRTPSR